MLKEISVLIPAYNEGISLIENVLTLNEFLKKYYKTFEIIISEDGSNDGSFFNKISKSNVKYIHFKKRLGKGLALKKAFSLSSGKYIFIIDADFPVKLDYIVKMTSYFPKYDVVIGSRLLKESKIKRSFLRSFASIVYNTLIRLLFRTGIKDHQCGVKVFKREILSAILPDMTSTGFFWDTELLVKVKMRTNKIHEIPLLWKDRDGWRFFLLGVLDRQCQP